MSLLRPVKKHAKAVLRPLTRPWSTRGRITRDLRALGVREGGALLVHGSLSSLGFVPGGGRAVVRALCDAIGREGTLVIPTHTWEWMNAGCRVFDARTTPGCIGALPEVFRSMPGVVRSLHPTHSVAALGPRALELTAGHEHSATPCGPGTPYARLLEMDAQILFLGTTLASNTCFHTFEAMSGFPQLMREEVPVFDIIDAAGRTEKVAVPLHLEGVVRRYAEMEEPFVSAGIAQRGKVGAAASILVEGGAMMRWTLDLLRKDPDALLAQPHA